LFEALVSQTQLSIFIQVTPVLQVTGVQQQRRRREEKREQAERRQSRKHDEQFILLRTYSHPSLMLLTLNTL